MNSMTNNIVSLTKKLIAIKSVPTDPQALEKSLNVAIADLKEFTIERFENNGYKSVLIYNTPKRPKQFKIILNGHLDIIPGKDFQYVPKVEGNKLYGVAAMDMKASVAAFVMVFKEIAKELDYPIGLQLVTDEELGGFHTTKYQLDNGVRTDFAIIGETTQFAIENQTKGVLWVKIAAKGKTAHGAYPWKGENAISRMNAFLTDLVKAYPIPTKEAWVTTINVGSMTTTNQTFNKVPDDCEVRLDIRFVPKDVKKILSDIKKLLPKGFRMEVIMHEPALATDEKNPYVQLLQKKAKDITKKHVAIVAANGSSDARHFARVQCPAVEFGPIGKGMGSDNEWVAIKSLEMYAQIVKDFLLSLNK